MLERDGIKIYLAKEFGFCWGVERSIDLAYVCVVMRDFTFAPL